MPLTLSHPAAVLPLRRLGLRGHDLAHSPLGVPTVDIVGALLVLAAHLRSLPPLGIRRPARVLTPAALAAVVVLAGLTGLASAAIKASVGLHAMAFHGVVSSIIVFVVGSVLVCVAWQVLRQRGRASVGEA
jgi:hypothetical protein